MHSRTSCAKSTSDFSRPALLVARAAGAQHLLDGIGEAVGIAQHEP
jgi:hypothetical protein